MALQRTYTFILLEDNETDVFLLRRRLGQLLPELRLEVAATQADYERLVRTLSPDVIISDYRLPQYSGIEALMFARKHAPVVPFIFVTGALHNEELAADTILKGASGFVLKNNLDKLDRIIPPLLDGERAGTTPAPADGQASPDGRASDDGQVSDDEQASADGQADVTPALSDVLGDLAAADADTLSEVKRLLAARRAADPKSARPRVGAS